MTPPRDKLASQIIFGLIVALGLFSCSSESIVDYYRTLTIDHHTLKVSYADSIWFGYVREITGEYYESRINVAIEPHRRTVAHFEKAGASPIMLGDMFVGADGRLFWRSKRQVVARLPEATIVAESSYFYVDGHAQFPPDVRVGAQKDLGWEVPSDVAALPASPPPRVTGAALVRVLKQGDGSVVVGSADYRLDGRPKALDTKSLHNGVLDFSNVAFQVNGQTFGNGASLVDEPEKRAAFGFPNLFKASDYLREPQWPAVPTVGMMPAIVPSVVGLVLIEYNLNEWVRRDEYVQGKPVRTTILRFKELLEDTMLAAIDGRT